MSDSKHWNKSNNRKQKILKASMDEKERREEKISLRRGVDNMEDRKWERPKLRIKKDEVKD